MACAGHVFKRISTKLALFIEDLPSFGSFGKAVSKEKIFFKLANQKQELPMAAMFVNGSELNDQSL
jgi:hypothetical protein